MQHLLVIFRHLDLDLDIINNLVKRDDLNHDLLDSQSVYSGLGVDRKILLFS
jgi:hypothetical protein